jgi:hypothetical protein
MSGASRLTELPVNAQPRPWDAAVDVEGIDVGAGLRQQTAPIRARPYYLRSPEQVAGFFDGLELVEPGVVRIAHWRPDPSPFELRETPQYGGVGRKR